MSTWAYRPEPRAKRFVTTGKAYKTVGGAVRRATRVVNRGVNPIADVTTTRTTVTGRTITERVARVYGPGMGAGVRGASTIQPPARAGKTVRIPKAVTTAFNALLADAQRQPVVSARDYAEAAAKRAEIERELAMPDRPSVNPYAYEQADA